MIESGQRDESKLELNWLLLADGAEDPAAAGREPVDAPLVEADHVLELLLVLEQLRHVHVDVLHRAVVPRELHHRFLHGKINTVIIVVGF